MVGVTNQVNDQVNDMFETHGVRQTLRFSECSVPIKISRGFRADAPNHLLLQRVEVL